MPLAGLTATAGGVLAGLVPSVNIPSVDDTYVGIAAAFMLISGAGYSFVQSVRGWTPADVANASLGTVSINLVLDELLDTIIKEWPDGRQKPDRELFGASIYRVFGTESKRELVRIVRRRSDDRPESRRSWSHGEGVAGCAWRDGEANPHARHVADLREVSGSTREQWAALRENGTEGDHYNMSFDDFDAVRAYSRVIGVPIPELPGARHREPGVVGVLTVDCMDSRYDIGKTAIVQRIADAAYALSPAVAAWPSDLRGTLRGELQREGVK